MKISLLLKIFFICLLPAITYSQYLPDDYAQLEAQAFIKEEHLKVLFPGGHDGWKPFVAKWNTLMTTGKGQINIVHIGSSHVQAGSMAHTARQYLQNIAPDWEGGRGLIFPYHMAGTNNPSDYKSTFSGTWTGYRSSVKAHESDFGICGVTAETFDNAASFRLFFKEDEYPNRVQFDRVRIYHPVGNAYYRPVWIGKTAPMLEWQSERLNYTEWVFDTLIDDIEVAFMLENEEKKFILQGVQVFKDKKPGITYHSIGVNGATTYSYMRGVDFQQQLKGLKPDLVIFGIGINDANSPNGEFNSLAYQQNYEQLMLAFKAANPKCAFLFMTHTDSYYKKRNPNRNVLEARLRQIELATRYQQGVFDKFEAMGGLGSILLWQRKGLASTDKIHFTREGYQLLGKMMGITLVQSLGDLLHEDYLTQIQKK